VSAVKTMKKAPILLATRNPGKLKELRPLFAAVGYPVTDLAEFQLEADAGEADVESFDSFEANALAKARYFYEISGGVATVADDSGLEVPALGGAPGVRSRRFSTAGTDVANNAKLLDAMKDVSDRSARFVCAAAFVGLGSEMVRLGATHGVITAAPRGSGGFGYDPLFESVELGKTFGEATLEEKARVSHRARAFAALLAAMQAAQ
jgi:XTP/dITP diphosphohydrolase